MNASHISDPVEDVILRLTRERGPGKTICPTEAARALAAEGEDFRRHLPKVRAAAIRLMQQKRLMITRKGKPLDTPEFKGVYRLGMPDEAP
ncbi:hypothetical protein GCM10007276_24740 [Agaricicola taiwanensis]|uniref:DUF3253 domain-containing protein n=1 Tax=Agaricicola taiwanensis TaxID=591372 RepID=A0A8J2YJD7_9RHOB|nr:DUF3253 domain-containing protein [Agaricicola taiwanensis]GGE46594.1 hypothetical protein GCM10007276_24740 [Agaricicola taiwanensis]